MKRFVKFITLAAASVAILATCDAAKLDDNGDNGSGQGQETQVPAEGITVYGQISCSGKGIAGVVVSDGIEVVATDADGMFQMKSDKKNGFVFISVPSGYEVESDGVRPLFCKKLSNDAQTAEKVDFNLREAGDQTDHTMLFFGDMHLANRTKDILQFATFTNEINNYLKDHPSKKVYAMTLGDMTWDLYWYTNKYTFYNYLLDAGAISNLQIFHAIGNHDHNMYTDVHGETEGWDSVDWDTGTKYRTEIAPSNYSFNIGKVHYISLDNIYCKNTTGHTGDDRKYAKNVCHEAMEWLKKDLSFVSHETPVVVAMHSPVYSQTGASYMENTPVFANCFKGYESVTFVTGHSHVLWNTFPDDNIREYNSGAVCAAWWWAGKYNPTLNVGQDGSPSGYRIMDVRGKRMTSFFKAIGRKDDYQFRTYDRNCICITPESTGVTGLDNATNFVADLDKYGAYNKESKANEVIIDVWDYDMFWNIEVTENGKKLNVTRFTGYEPLFFIAYTAPRYKESKTVSWNPYKTNHLFKVTASSATSTLEIKVTDDEGRIYSETMTRPKAFTIAQYK